MRRALVIAGAILAGLLALAPALGTAASSPLPEEVVEFEPEGATFSLLVEGFTVEVLAGYNGIERTATLSISRDGLTSTYQVPAKLTDDSVRARFGNLGDLNFHFAQKKGARKCLGELTFTGSFTFAGEGGYVHIDATEAEGRRVGGEFLLCGTEEEEGFLEVGESAELEAIAGSIERGSGRQVIADEWRSEGGHRRLDVSASQVEEREGMRITHQLRVHPRPGAFRHDVESGTATLKPPASFTGWAHLTPGRDGKGVLRGTLRAPTFGGKPIELTGPAFRVHLH